jgi:DNA-directed RNA polymerase subunit RPC12/RpoP
MAGEGMSATPKSGQSYICESCGETYVSDWTDSEADTEALEKWGPLAAEDRAVVCDDCFREFIAWHEKRSA